jgi:hypothetical protein
MQTVTGDFNVDGAPDLALFNSGCMGTNVFFNQGGVHVRLTSSVNTSHHGGPITFTATVIPSFRGNTMPTAAVA